MGWRGTVRSLAAAARAAEREAQRRHKQALKEQMTSNAADAVVKWEQYIDELVHIRADNTEPIDWHIIASKPKPDEPLQKRTHEKAATEALERFVPRWFDFLQGGSERKLGKLQEALASASKRDVAEYEDAKAQFIRDMSDWESDTSLAGRILKGEPAAYKEAIEEFLSASKDELIGSSIAVSFSEEFVHAKLTVHSTEIIPGFQLKQSASGKLSETKMPISRFNELYQDYVANAAFRVANDVFRVLPINEIYVTCLTIMLNSQTGHQELTPILSVQFVRETLSHMDLSHVDPSDGLSNFNHAMQFKKSVGFARINPLKSVD